MSRPTACAVLLFVGAGCGGVHLEQEAAGCGGSGDGGTAVTGVCQPCVENADCAGGGLCLGDVGHCGADCSMAEACGHGTQCTGVGFGRQLLGQQCEPTTEACGTGRVQCLDCSDTWEGYAQGFFQTHCGSCHGTITKESLGGWVRYEIDVRAMPQGTPLTDSERHRILTWLACNAATPTEPFQSPATPSAAR
jgi:hypothetical protein